MQILLELINDNFDSAFDSHFINVVLLLAIANVLTRKTKILFESSSEVLKILIYVEFKSFNSSAFSRVGHFHVLFKWSHFVELDLVKFTYFLYFSKHSRFMQFTTNSNNTK